MSKHENFWIVSILRGVLALLIGSFVLVVPDMARTILFLRFALAFVILSLATYGIADSILVLITSFFTSLRPARAALRVQSPAPRRNLRCRGKDRCCKSFAAPSRIACLRLSRRVRSGADSNGRSHALNRPSTGPKAQAEGQ